MALTLTNICFSYAGGSTASKLLDGLDLIVEKGSITALIGLNGTGKTTLLNILSGFEMGYEGEIHFNGKPLRGLTTHQCTRQKTGRLFQGARLSDDLTLFENMMLAFPNQENESPLAAWVRRKRIAENERKGRNKAISVIDSFFGSDNKYVGKLDQTAKSFSYGEQRIFAFLRLMMDDNDLLLLDEPTSGVNSIHFSRMADILHQLKDKGATILMVEHNMGFVREAADHCAYLEDGRILKSGSVESVLSDDGIKSKYLGL